MPNMTVIPSAHPADPNRAWARAIIDELIRGGVSHICVSPGSRSTPLTLAAAERASAEVGTAARVSSGSVPAGSADSIDRAASSAAADIDVAIGPSVRLSVHYDERSAAFFALGHARATGNPALCICTSGTAAANYLPAVIEAHYSRAPLILLTADRPPELRDTGAWQVIDQTKLYGVYTRWYAELGLPSDSREQLRYACGVAARAAAVSLGRPPGPVHINVPLREPFPPWDARDQKDLSAQVAPSPSSDVAATRLGPTTHASETAPPAAAIEALVERIRATPRGLILAGRLNSSPTREYADAVARLAQASGYPILAEPMGGLRFGPHDRSNVVTGYDAFLREPTWIADSASAPQLILRLGATFTWRTVADALARFPEAHSAVVDPEGTWDDPARLADERFEADPVAVCAALFERLEGLALSESRMAEASRWRRRWIDAAERTATVRHRTLAGSLIPNGQPAISRVEGGEQPSDTRAATSAWVSQAALDAIGERSGLIWVANSMAVRDIDTFTGARPEPVTVMAGRGAAGIDGTLSQALGAAQGWQSESLPQPAESPAATHPTESPTRSRPAILITGDLAFLHDVNGLAASMPDGPQLAVIVVDDAGGGIFEYLPVAGGARPAFERYFATPPQVDIETVCRAFDVPSNTVLTPEALVTALRVAIEAGGLRVIRVPVDRTSNTALHRAYWAAVAEDGSGVGRGDDGRDEGGSSGSAR